MKNNRTLFPKTLIGLAALGILLPACDLREKSSKGVTQGKNEIAQSRDNCDAYKTANQADGENHVQRPGFDYKFNLYWSGPESKVSVWEDNVLDDNYYLSFKPLTIHILDGN